MSTFSENESKQVALTVSTTFSDFFFFKLGFILVRRVIIELYERV